jgi:peptidoglycan/LPS O-acetylase OafA/YrhL
MLEKQRISYLDGLRGIAVLLVFFSHSSGRDFQLHPSLNFQGLGHIGVYLFFVLSAFLLGNGLFNEGVNAISVKRFYIKRFFRIIPLYYLVLITVFAFQYYNQAVNPTYLHINGGSIGLLKHLLLYQGDGVFWSVVVEMQFYVFVPLIVYLLIKFRGKALVFLWVLAILHFVLYLCKFLHWPVNTNLIASFTPNSMKNGMYLDMFMAGITASYLLKYNFELLALHKKTIQWVSTSLFILLMSATIIMVSENFMNFNEPFYKLRYISILYAVIFSFFTLSVYIGNTVNVLLDNMFMRNMGIWGFSVYLLHMAVFQIVHFFNINGIIGFFIVLPLIMIVSFLTYTFIEKKSIDISYYLIKKLNLINKKS